MVPCAATQGVPPRLYRSQGPAAAREPEATRPRASVLTLLSRENIVKIVWSRNNGKGVPSSVITSSIRSLHDHRSRTAVIWIVEEMKPAVSCPSLHDLHSNSVSISVLSVKFLQSFGLGYIDKLLLMRENGYDAGTFGAALKPRVEKNSRSPAMR